MEEYKCIDKRDKRTEKLFLRLPSLLYGEDSGQDTKAEKSLLRGKHPLSCDVEVCPFVVIGNNGDALCRCLLTYYPNDSVAYVGFFEADQNVDAVR